MRRLAALVLAAALALAGCSSADPEVEISGAVGRIDDIEVSVGDTRAPVLMWPREKEFTRAETAVLWNGDGDQLRDGQPLLLDMFIQDLVTGEVLQNTFDGLPRPTLLAPEMLGDDLYQVLRTLRVGARVLAVVPSAGEFEEEPTFAVVIDVLSHRAEGATVNPRNDIPIVINGGTGEPDIILREGKDLPPDLVVATLIRGEGEQVQPGSHIIAQYKAIFTADGSDAEGAWIKGGVFDSTWAPARAPWEVQIGVGDTIRALDEGLIDQTAGSQVMIIAPESFGYPGKGTLVFVVDILDVWTPEE